MADSNTYNQFQTNFELYQFLFQKLSNQLVEMLRLQSFGIIVQKRWNLRT